MVRPRSSYVNPNCSGTFHVISRCTRREFLLGGDKSYRKDWVIDELGSLLPVFSVDLLGYAVMSNHVHLILRTRPDLAASKTAVEIAREGITVMPIRSGRANEKLPLTDDLIDHMSQQSPWVDEYRQRLASISWLMRLMKQRIASKANREDHCTGHFWESRFQSVPLLDWSAVLACMVYVDLNPYRARIISRPDASSYCSLRSHIGLRSKKVDKVLTKRLVPLSDTYPRVIQENPFPRAGITRNIYYHLIKSATSKRPQAATVQSFDTICSQHGFELNAWHERMSQPGLFQSGAAGSPESRKQYAESVGKKWIADKTGIWRKS